jgi:hypothetical protein
MGGHINGKIKDKIMVNIYYKKTDGKATDLQWKKVPDEDDILYTSTNGMLPDIETLHDESYIEAQNALQYQRDRQLEYPSMADQLDYIYHNGIAKWKSDMVKPVKDAHPKP